MSHVRRGEGAGAEDLASLGGKARSLHELVARTRAKVPPWFVVDSGAFLAAVRSAGIEAELAAHLDELGRAGGSRDAVDACRRGIEPLLERLLLDGTTRQELAGAYRALGAGPVAVRSSALDEDGATASFAGCLDTFLFVDGADDVAQAVVRCWRSAFSERSLAYRAAHGRLGAAHPVVVAVVVQRVIDGDASGVLFTVDPSNGDPAVATISSTWGLGEGVVSGVLDCDTFRVARADGAIVTRDVVAKERKLARDPSGKGTVHVDVAAAHHERPSLDDSAIEALATLGWEIEAAYGAPMDIEWTWDGDGLWILQARFVTTGQAASTVGSDGDRGGRKATRLWDNSNIIESFDGVTTPFTFSHARRSYTMVYRQTMALLGVSAASLDEQSAIFEQFLGYLDGRIYYSLESWYRVLKLLPGYQFNAEFMEQMMGVSQRASFGDEGRARPPGVAERYLVALPRLLASLVALSRRFAGVEQLVADFFALFDRELARLEEIPLAEQSLDALTDIYSESEQRITRHWEAPIVNNLLAMIFFGTLRKLVTKWQLGADSLANDLLCGEGGLISAEPTRDLLRLVEDLRRDPAALALLLEAEAETVRRQVETEPRFGWWKVRMQQHVDRFGDRCIDEQKVEEPTLREDPIFLYRTLKGYAASPPLTVEQLETREAGIRAAAEKTARAQLKSASRRRTFEWVLTRARRHVKHRENLRFCRTRAYGFVRRLALAMGTRLVESGTLDRVDDVFFLEIDELIHFARGTATTYDLRGLAGVRRAEVERHRRAEELPERFETSGAVGLSPLLRRNQAAGGSGVAAPAAAVAAGGTILQGTAASPGVVRAQARLVRDPRHAVLAGHVLVANRTDPGWVPLFPSASAIVVERGSVLSHSAIVAREFGIPCVVGLRDALAQIPDGALLEVDGTRGTVTLLEDQPAVVTPVATSSTTKRL